MSTGATVAAASRRMERRLVEHLRSAGAVAASSATAIPDQSWMGSRVVRRLRNAGAIREAGGGFYLDEAAYAAFRARRMRMMALIVAPLTVAAIFVVWWLSPK